MQPYVLSLFSCIPIIFFDEQRESKTKRDYTANNSCPTIGYNHSNAFYEHSRPFTEQRSKQLSRFNETRFAEYLYIANFDKILGKRFDWRVKSHVDYYVKNVFFSSLIRSGGKLVDSAVIRVNIELELLCKKSCEYDKSVSCWKNFQFVNFIDTISTISNGFFIRYELANVTYDSYMDYFVSSLDMNELFIHEISEECAECLDDFFQ